MFLNLARGTGMQVSSVLQKTSIQIDESGSRRSPPDGGSASTTPFSESDHIHNFKADHPFLFIIEDETTGTLIFMGKIYSPSRPAQDGNFIDKRTVIQEK